MSSSTWEQDAVENVRERLAQRYPHVPDEIVEATVRRAHAEFDGPIRDFVPLLVEKAARARLEDLQRRAAVEPGPEAGATPGAVPHPRPNAVPGVESRARRPLTPA